MRNSRINTVSLVAAALLAVASLSNAAQDDQLLFDAARLTEALALKVGSDVADIGAGDGKLSLILARQVGPSGHVYATDLNRDRLDAIRHAAELEQLTNVLVVQGHETRTNLEDGCCDSLVVRFVYHHFGDPSAMNASLHGALRPGGRLAVIDFSPRGSESESPAGRGSGPHHGVTPETVTRELTEAGFRLLLTKRGPEDRVFMVVVQRPLSQ